MTDPMMRFHHHDRLSHAVVFACVLLVGCGGAHFDGTVYRGDGFSFRIPAPPSQYRRVETSRDALSFRDMNGEATILLGGRCGTDRDDVPLKALTQHLFLQFSERTILTEEVVPFDRREALHTMLTAKLDGVAMKYDVWVLKKDECIYDLLYMAPPIDFPRGLEAFRTLVAGFATVDSNAP